MGTPFAAGENLTSVQMGQRVARDLRVALFRKIEKWTAPNGPIQASSRPTQTVYLRTTRLYNKNIIEQPLRHRGAHAIRSANQDR